MLCWQRCKRAENAHLRCVNGAFPRVCTLPAQLDRISEMPSMFIFNIALVISGFGCEFFAVGFGCVSSLVR